MLLPSALARRLARALVRVNAIARVDRVVLEQLEEQTRLALLRNRVERLRELSTGAALAASSTRTGIVSMSLISAEISGGRVAEKKSVWRSPGSSVQNAADVGQKAHVEHAVGFVEDEERDVVERRRALRNGRAGVRASRR